MKRWILTIFVAIVAALPVRCFAHERVALRDSCVFVNPDIPPQYLNGGNEGLAADLYSTLAKLISVEQDTVQGRAVVSFKITKEGAIVPESIKILRNRSVPDDYLKAAIEAIKHLGKFDPAKRYGTPLPVTYNFPILYPLPPKYIITE